MTAPRWLLAALGSILVLNAVVEAGPALADRRVALVIGNSAYVNVPRLANPANDARLVAGTLKDLGFTLIGGGPGIDLDKASFDIALENFGRQVQGADVALFYYAGHGVQVAGKNFLVPITANPAREADVYLQMVDLNILLSQMDGSGTKLNIVILDACRNNPFGGRGLRSAVSGLAQMQAPEGTLISYATQPGNVALDGAGEDSPYTLALTGAMRRPGLDIFRTFNEVGLAVASATGGAQQPWVSLSPIKGNFYFGGPAIANTADAAATDQAARVWSTIKDTTSLAQIDAFIENYGSTIYGRFAEARRDELRNSQIALAPSVAAQGSKANPIGREDVTKLFDPFAQILQQVEANYVDKPNEQILLSDALRGMLKRFPSAQRLASAAKARELPSDRLNVGGGDKLDLNSIYDAAMQILTDSGSSADGAALRQAAVDGMLAGLDPHAYYMDPNGFRGMQQASRGDLGGPGMEITMEAGLAKVVAPIDDTPAAKAGVRTNDIVTQINGKSTQGLTLREITDKLRGPPGTNVALTIARGNNSPPIELTLVREVIRVAPVRSRTEGDDVGYIRITQFNEAATAGLKQAVDELAGQLGPKKIKGYVIDLRNNPGGLLDQAISLADAFLQKGEIVSTRGRVAEETQHFNARPGDVTNGKRLVVLINGGTAAGAEILAGALQDNKRAVILGTRSFGKGGVQTIIPLGRDSGALVLTTARYYTPSGRSIQLNGITPDIEVRQNAPDLPAGAPGASLVSNQKDVLSQSYIPPDEKDDLALNAALDLIRQNKIQSR